ncbi:MAG: hypothetical protein JJU36_10770 [Phycisphaeraceae bacterium]|nr:hypothetical protein [Phycisphaeraceae bacterium]
MAEREPSSQQSSDSLGSVEEWRTLASPAMAELLEQARGIDPANAAAIERLRRSADPQQVRLAVALGRARRKLQEKWPRDHGDLWADPRGAEQASSRLAALYKADRLARLMGDGGDEPRRPIMDLACGIGADALGMVRCGLEVEGLDIEPVRAWMMSKNTGAPAEVGDAAKVEIKGRWVHMDPSRRSAGRRMVRLEDYQPGVETIRQIIADARGGVIKLGPGVAIRQAAELAPNGTLELISEGGKLTQMLLWWKADGSPTGADRRATLLRDGHEPESFEGDSSIGVPTGEWDDWVWTVDAAIERLGLMGSLAVELKLCSPLAACGLLTGGEPVSSVWLRGFRVMDVLPWRFKAIKRWLLRHDAGVVEIKTRGRLLDTDLAQRELRGRGEQPFAIFAVRLGEKIQAVITRRDDESAGA